MSGKTTSQPLIKNINNPYVKKLLKTPVKKVNYIKEKIKEKKKKGLRPLLKKFIGYETH